MGACGFGIGRVVIITSSHKLSSSLVHGINLYIYIFQVCENTKVNVLIFFISGSLDSEACIYALSYDISGSRLVTCEADKTIKMWKQDENATPETHPINFKPPREIRRYWRGAKTSKFRLADWNLSFVLWYSLNFVISCWLVWKPPLYFDSELY